MRRGRPKPHAKHTRTLAARTTANPRPRSKAEQLGRPNLGERVREFRVGVNPIVGRGQKIKLAYITCKCANQSELVRPYMGDS